MQLQLDLPEPALWDKVNLKLGSHTALLGWSWLPPCCLAHVYASSSEASPTSPNIHHVMEMVPMPAHEDLCRYPEALEISLPGRGQEDINIQLKS
ncbi:MAG: hypothetical protein FRX49_11786 [Trebouxia sp. A1-2]|nr:MAG: hypothetical protein FRX49_11786 [Trebouxia sp. A1-2]